MAKKSFHICESERQLLDLTGNGNELVKLTVEFDRPNYYLNGFYLFLRDENKTNNFIRQSPTDQIIIDQLSSATRYIQFDRKAGIILDSFHRSYTPAGPQTPGYDALVEKLKAVEEWQVAQRRPTSGSLSLTASARTSKRKFSTYNNDNAW